jgi:Holliday junction DNA helicase RuvA
MINYLKGILVSRVEDGPSGCNITVEVNEIGYLALTNSRVMSSLPEVGEKVTIYTSLIHREDAMFLCGFSTREERDLFNILQTVSGVGTRTALILLGELGAYNLMDAVISDNTKALSSAKGVGPKLAQKIILELSDKMKNWRNKNSVPVLKGQKNSDPEFTEGYLEAETVLLSLGYTKNEAGESLKQALKNVHDKNDTEEILRFSLKWLVNQK